MKKLDLNIISISTFLFAFFLIFGNNKQYILLSNLLSVIYIILSLLYVKIQKIKIDKFLSSFLIFIIFSGFSLIWSINIQNSLRTILTMIIIFLVLVLLRNNFLNDRIKKAFILGLFFGLLINFLAYKRLITLPMDIYEYDRLQGTMGKSNILALASIYYLIIIFFYYYKNHFKNKFEILIFISSFFICSELILATGSRKGLLGLILVSVLMFIFIFTKSKIIISRNFIVRYILIFSIFFGMVYFIINSENLELSLKRFEGLTIMSDNRFMDASTEERARLIKESTSVFMDSPFIGNGVNTFSTIEGRYSHSNFGEISTGLGIVGIILYYRIYYFLFRSIRFNERLVQFSVFLTFVILVLYEFSFVSYYDKFNLIALYFIYIELNSHE